MGHEIVSSEDITVVDVIHLTIDPHIFPNIEVPHIQMGS